MLANYLTDTQNLLQLPSAPTNLYPTDNVTRWINIARGQLAGDAECIRVIGTLATVPGQRAYNFSSINLGVSATTGVSGAIHVRRISFDVATGQRWIPVRPWPWFELYSLNNPVPQAGPPQRWSQYGQGSAGTGTGSGASGSFYLDPPPDLVYTLNLDCVCYPIDLVSASTVEAIPYLWTTAVPFFAAYYALLSSQTSARQNDANRMYENYKAFIERAREAANPSILRWQNPQAADPAQANKIGIQRGG